MGGPKVSVVIAAYAPGEGFDRVVASLDAQTLPQDVFEVIVVDDGSPDDTADRLRAVAATRPNWRIERIENSGWPSRPRNVGTALATGEHVLFMDHDDSLYPDALRRLVDYAAETRADVVSPKESKTTDPWWNIQTLQRGNVADITRDGGIAQLLPMVPHKLYRRAFLAEHGIAFPEGRRRLWEDVYVNVAAWRHAERVAVLADTPVYRWHASRTNNSKSYGPLTTEYWDRLDDLLAFITETLAADPEALRSALLHQYQGRVLGRLGKHLRDPEADPEAVAAAIDRATAAQQRFFSEAHDAALAGFDRARAVLLRTGRADLLRALAEVDADTAPVVTATGAQWRDGALHLDVRVDWVTRDGAPAAFERVGERVLRALPVELRAVLPEGVVDVTDTIDDLRVGIGVRDRDEAVTWLLPGEHRAAWEAQDDGRPVPVLHGTAVLDPALAAAGRPLADRVHDLVAGVEWDAADYWARSVRYEGPAVPAVVRGRPGVAYKSKKGALALDLSSGLRNVLADGGAPAGRIAGTTAGLTLPLPRVAVTGEASLTAAVRLTAAEGGAVVELPGVLITDASGARLEVGTRERVPNGAYELAYRIGDRPFFGKRPVQVAKGVVTIVPKGGSAPPPPQGLLGSLRRRIGR
ncbi:glycosyltransferase family 2 protein [Amnibacterium setariae]|uniref:Glycosyltransferase n=1 Tax=Amnibacterium setariae TaxID=2306585 RepID=A0A3A1TWR8_9MICO|nr:glycosyltransferase [Amnibacterium setariae]RIX26588.1 glycosyltransferase [Amnibacterium setariae]